MLGFSQWSGDLGCVRMRPQQGGPGWVTLLTVMGLASVSEKAATCSPAGFLHVRMRGFTVAHHTPHWMSTLFPEGSFTFLGETQFQL